MSRFERIVHSRSLADGRSGELISFSREEAGWEWMNFRVTRLNPGEILESGSPTEETVLLLLGGTCHADWGTGSNKIGKRRDVFDGLPKPSQTEGRNRLRSGWALMQCARKRAKDWSQL